ncbi:MAG: glycosyltransferase family 39 protein, partial [Chloroflexota bacterium]|nr:glycosyltransferase family 39 protein [Chloroflexota bacterium]
MATVEEPVQVPAGGLNPAGGNQRRDEILRTLAGILLALGVVVVVAAFIPGLPGGIPDPRQSDLVLAPLVAAGLLLLGAAGVVRGVRADSRQARPALAGPAISARVEFALVGLVVAVFAGAVSLGIAQRTPFGWDESVYALISRHWLFGTPASGWGPYRPPALSLLAVIPNLVTSNEAAFRAIGLAFGCLTVLAVWLVARRLGGVAAGLVAAVVIASAQPIQINAGFLLNDVPAVGLLALLVAVLWRVMEDDRSGWSMLWIAPIAALSFYVRYGAAVPIG